METIIITNSDLKKNLLENRKKLINQRIMTMNEFMSKFLFSYDERAIYYLMKKYRYKYNVAITLLNNMKYLNKNYKCELNSIKKELEKENLLIYDNQFKSSMMDKNIIIYNYPINTFEKGVLKNLNYIEQNYNYCSKKYDIYEFNTIEDEVNFVAIRIIEYIQNGTDINKIKIMNMTDEYKNYITRIFKLYNIPIEEKYILYSNNEILKFIKLLKETKNLERSLNAIENIYIKKQVLKIVNKYDFIDVIDDIYIEILISDLKNTKITVEKYKNKIEFINHCDKDDIVFHIGFNDSFPKYFKDEDYFSDEVKKILNIDTSIKANELLEKQLLNEYSNYSNIIFSYSKKTDSGEYHISQLSDNMDINITNNFEDKYIYSNKYNKIRLGKFIDEKNKFNITNKNLNKLYYNYKDIKYKDYDNKFTGIDKNELYDYLNNKIILSYSSVDNYYKCAFKYYLNNILKINNKEETFAIKIGSIFHHVLEKYSVSNFEHLFAEAVSAYEFDSKEKIFLKKLKEELLFVIKTIEKQNKLSSFDQELHEKKVYINKDKTISVTFMGIIDKIKYTNNNDRTLLAIIDYKTGNPSTSLTSTHYGLDMQLPIYIYLSKHIENFNNIEVAGIYLQKILNNEFYYESNKDYEKEKENNLKLEGYSVDDEEIISLFDHSYQNSEMIKSMKKSKNGFYSYTKLLTKKQIDNLYNLVDKKIDEARDNILDANFSINPKKMDKENTCKYCPFIDICHRCEENFIQIKMPTDLSFLEEYYAKVD